MDLEGLAFDLVVLLAFLTVGWYIVGTLRQRRAISAYVRAIGGTAEGLAREGKRPSIKWFGQVGFQIVVDDAKAPFKRLSLVVVLSPRELLLIWLANLLRGKGDLVVVRADLERLPRQAVEAYRGAPGQDARAQIGEAWSTARSDGLVVRSPMSGEELARGLGALAGLRRVSVSRTSPHLIVEVDGANVRGDPAGFPTTLMEVAKLVA